MNLSKERLHRVIMESINKMDMDVVDAFKDINSRNPLTPWDPETKMERMRPGNAARAMNIKPAKDFKIHTYDDWVRNYKPQGISWKEYEKMEL